MRILFIGDTHAAWHRIYDGIQQAVRELEVHMAVQVGDFGFFNQYSPTPLGNGSRFRIPIPLHVIDGNHEDHKWLRKRIEDGTTKRWAEEQNIIYQTRGSLVRFKDVSIGFCGGALHADRAQEGSLVRGTTNWLSNRESDQAAKSFNDARPEIIITHSCPHSIGIGMIGNPHFAESVERYISRKGYNAGPIADCGEPGLHHLWHRLRHRPREWVFGHFHAHRTAVIDEVQFRCVGAIDGSDGRPDSIMYILDTSSWSWSTMTIRASPQHSDYAY